MNHPVIGDPDILGIRFNGLKCDTPRCGYRNLNVPFVEYRDWIGQPCPKCGGNLLTQEEYDKSVLLYKIVQRISSNPIVRFLSWTGILGSRKVKAKVNVLAGRGDQDTVDISDVEVVDK